MFEQGGRVEGRLYQPGGPLLVYALALLAIRDAASQHSTSAKPGGL